MYDPSKMSVEEILAACRSLDGEGGSAPAPAAEAPASASTPAEPPKVESPKPASAKKPGAMSVEEMLAAARAEKAGGGATSPVASQPAEPAKPAAPAKKPSAKMSVEEMLAAARGEKTAGAKAEKAPAKAPPKGAAKVAAPKEKAPAEADGPLTTASILAAARGKAEKRGPLSKAEAAAKEQAAEAADAPKKKTRVVPPMPERPAFARPTPAAAAADRQDRRGFMASLTGIFFGSSLAVGFSSLLVTQLLWVLGLARFMFPNILTEPPTKFKVGFPDDFGPGQVATKFKAQFGVWIVRYEYEGQAEIYALKSVCTHLGCTPNWLEGEQKFKCPCHGSGFYKDGINFEGPAPRPLERYGIRLADDGQIEVDKSREFLEEKGEWKDPASFVPV